MLDLKELRSSPDELEKKLQTKDTAIQIEPILALDREIRETLAKTEELKAKRNAMSKEIGQRKQNGEDCSSQMQEVRSIGDQIQSHDQYVKDLEAKRNLSLATLPNLPMDDVPISPSPKDNICLKSWNAKPAFGFPFLNHLELNEKLNLFDFQKAAKISGSGWPMYTHRGATLEWALLNYMLDTHKKNGFHQIIPPLLVKSDAMYGSAQLPKFESQLFQLKDEDFHLYLIPTAEVPLNGMHLDEILEEKDLPLKYTAYTPCFRREAGAAGSQERGLIRTHQFNKVEMFCVTTPEESETVFEQMVRSAEEILEGLNLHYRSMLLTTGDMSFAAAKTIDIEAWLPGQDRYYEVSSVSNCTDFQARRSETRCKKKGEKPRFVHTLNGSGLATSRLMVALLENNQQPDGTVLLPKVLERYLGKDHLKLEPVTEE